MARKNKINGEERAVFPLGVGVVTVWLMVFAWDRPGLMLPGIALAVVVGILFRREIPPRPARTGSGRIPVNILLRRLGRVLVFLPRFVGLVFYAGFQIAGLALRPTLDFWPGIVRIKGGLPNRKATTLFAHLITLTPGTVAVDYDEDADDLYVHWIDVAEAEDTDLDARVSGGMRPWVRSLFQ